MASNQVAKLKDDILDLNLYTYRAIKDAKQIYVSIQLLYHVTKLGTNFVFQIYPLKYIMVTLQTNIF